MGFFRVLWEELYAICTQTAVVFVVVVGSLLYAFLYPAPYQNDIVVSQKIAVVDGDNTSLSRELAFLVNASAQTDVAYRLTAIKTAKKLLEQGKIYGILQIPEGFQSKIYKGMIAPIDYFGNASYFLIYGAGLSGVVGASDALSNAIKSMRDLRAQSQSFAPNLIQADPIALFNPNEGYINYALAAILVFILHQTMIAGAGILGALQNQKNSLGIRGYWNQVGACKLVLARICAFSLIYVVFFLFYFGFLFQMYGIHIHSDIISFWSLGLMFIFCCASFGVLLGVVIKRPALPTQIILISSLPLVFMMGFVWPKELLPSYILAFVQFIPAFHGINAMIALNQMGASLGCVMGHFYWLLGLFIGAVVLSVWVIRNKRK
ncbi:hypothetical protein BKH46_05320 [Helicobacter sp. 12S02634-8]|uniref:ABC transporter permease n=1 Tax=Helicobacter sp. 12S02634-8 TaxID=1476199 RepID=UPI000BA5CAF2|nr:ABC transporter permease [Helicobacter sp. 12S02634-8]PAF47129.1 hypothetical protein BKH46_05320 [Helicobacter sp. 12S02634-8]